MRVGSDRAECVGVRSEWGKAICMQLQGFFDV